MNAVISAGGSSAHQMVFGPNPVDRFRRDTRGEDLLLAQGASLPAQFAQQWKFRMMAQGAALNEVANRNCVVFWRTTSPSAARI